MKEYTLEKPGVPASSGRDTLSLSAAAPPKGGDQAGRNARFRDIFPRHALSLVAHQHSLKEY
ncbi:MAG: hypothetical protein COU10_01240 [Candidatus Harrisonbacteria bacterium CG10_big_fil_rev_8_21_14_0_10_45_28]|uniref:Uncharacterized protein n=1 Tax=Candidatus Harrisonbacteria bacterium CG10_big_fil_rev_8_21_14_0_10_45_28 TaxID=1974586 RepID=A0A2H0UQI5_9BACT|nr:MAG: hypothetical protein COU10_01240 [Candidatus Harrisonbacteria bacterium CG10_big_fil_rev_8_21_14_0_10_45_28]